MPRFASRMVRLSHVARYLGLGALLLAAPALAKDGATAVDVEIVLAVDISYSMDTEEQQLQRAGYIAALRSDQFVNALRSGPHGRIAVAYMQWASSFDHDVVVEWVVIDGAESAAEVALKLEQAPYRRAQRTSISGAIDKAKSMFVGNGFNGTRRVIDISGDGPNNNGRPVESARDEAVASGITINGLPLLIRAPNTGWQEIGNLDEYYEDCVIGGPGAFMIAIKDRKQFVDATRTKLVMEIASAPYVPRISDEIRVVPAQHSPPRVSCMIGERMWQNRWGN